MVLLERKILLFTLDPEPSRNMRKREREDIWESVKEEVLKTLECLKKFFGFEDKEFSEDFLENIELKEKSINTCTINSIYSLKVTGSRTRKF